MGQASRRKRSRRNEAQRQQDEQNRLKKLTKTYEELVDALKVPKEYFHPAKVPSYGASFSSALVAAHQAQKAHKAAMYAALYGMPYTPVGTRSGRFSSSKPNMRSVFTTHDAIIVEYAAAEPDEPANSFLFGRSYVCGRCPRSVLCWQGQHPDVCARCRIVITRHDEVKAIKVWSSTDQFTHPYQEAHENYHLERNRVPTSCPIFFSSEQKCLRCDPTFDGTKRRTNKTPRRPFAVAVYTMDNEGRMELHRQLSPPRRCDAPMDPIKVFLAGRQRGTDLHERRLLRFARKNPKRGRYLRP